MNGGPALDRRHFIQLGAGAAAWAAGTTWGKTLAQAAPAQRPGCDPFLQLALQHRFIDHDPQAWPLGTRLCLQWPRTANRALPDWLGPAARVQSTFHDATHHWATVWASAAAIEHWHAQGLLTDFTDHLWGAPWLDPHHIQGDTHPVDQTPERHAERHPAALARTTPAQPEPGPQRTLIIDQGFPMQHLQQEGIAHRYRASWAAVPSLGWNRAYRHGSQVLGLWLQQNRHTTQHNPLLLYELPAALQRTMPLGALWPDVVDAVIWAIDSCAPGATLAVLLSVVSTDGDRHPTSHITRCAQALAWHAHSRGITLRWMMAAGNSHADRQNLRFALPASQSVQWQWHLPALNHRASLLECWHNAPASAVQFSLTPPGPNNPAAPTPLTIASRTNIQSGRTHTVFRLPATAAWQADQPLARPGAWQIRCETSQPCQLEVNLSMMAQHGMGLQRQAWLETDDAGPYIRAALSVSGLVPWMPGVWAAQCLQASTHSERANAGQPTTASLSHYSGRWPPTHPSHGLRAIAVALDASPLWSGALTLSANGHRRYRVSGTSMVVPLLAHKIFTPGVT